MTSKPISPDFDWVIARSNCSIAVVFKELELGVIDDLEKAQSLVPPKNQWKKFSVTNTIGNRFAASRIDNTLTGFAKFVSFSCTDSEIQVLDANDRLLMAATLTLTNEGECKLKVGDQELYQWQFRRMALEGLLFPAG